MLQTHAEVESGIVFLQVDEDVNMVFASLTYLSFTGALPQTPEYFYQQGCDDYRLRISTSPFSTAVLVFQPLVA